MPEDLQKRAHLTTLREGDVFVAVLSVVKAKRSDSGRYTCHPVGVDPVDLKAQSETFPCVHIFISCTHTYPFWFSLSLSPLFISNFKCQTIDSRDVKLRVLAAHRERSRRRRAESVEERLRRRQPFAAAVCRALLQLFPQPAFLHGGFGSAEEETTANRFARHFMGIGTTMS